VLASLPFGAMAEFVRVPAVRCVALPDAMPFDEAASFQVTYGTCYYALRTRGGLAPGETLLVLGASGGIGLAAVELGKALGARVVAAASSEAKCKLASAAGADAVLAYPPGPLSREDAKAFSAALRQAAGGDGVDLVIDPVGGDYAEPALRAMTWGGRYLVVGFTAGIPVMPLNLALLKSTSIIGVFWGAHMARAPETGAREMADLLALYAAGRVRPRISARFPLAQAGEAIALLARRQSTGKLVVQVRPDGASCTMPAADSQLPPERSP